MTKIPKPSSEAGARNPKTENQLSMRKRTPVGCENLMPLASPLDIYELSSLDTNRRKVYHGGENIVTVT